MVCLDEYFLTSIAAVEDQWILPKRNMLKEVIKMKKPFQVYLVNIHGLGLCVFNLSPSGIIREPSRARFAVRDEW